MSKHVWGKSHVVKGCCSFGCSSCGYGDHAEWHGSVHAGSMFFIGAVDRHTSFKVKSITVEYKMSEVPLPAAGFLLLGGLGGLAALKRRKKA